VTRLVARLVVDYFAHVSRPGGSARRAARHRLLRLRRASGCLCSLHDLSSTTSPTPHVRVPRHLVWLVARLVAPLVVDYFAYAARPGASAHHAARRAARRAARHRPLRLRRASGCLGTSRGSSRDSSHSSLSTTSPTPRDRVPRHVARLVTRLVVDYFDYTAHPDASAHCAARRRLLRLRRATGCLGTSRGSSHGSSLTTLTRPRVWVPRHVVRLIVDYFDYIARPGASARHTARRVARRRLLCLTQTCRRLLRLRSATECLGMSCGSSRRSSSTASSMPRDRVPRHLARLVAPLVVDYFAYAVRPGASAHSAAHHAARRAARRRLLRLRRASGCLGTSRGSSSTTSPTPCIRVPRHIARLITQLVAPLVVDYFAYAARLGASACCAARHAARRRLLCAPPFDFSHAVHRDYLSRSNTGSTSSTPCAPTISSSGRITLTTHLD
jgi:hypothetical protein